MKFVLKFFAWAACILIVIGTFFKVLHWPGSSILVIFGSLFFIFCYLPLWFYEAYKTKEFRYFTIVQFITLFLYGTTALLKFQHWPFGGVFYNILLLILLFVFLPSWLYKLKKNKENVFSYSHLTAVLVVIFSFNLVSTSRSISTSTFNAMAKSGTQTEKAYEKVKQKNEHLYGAIKIITQPADSSYYKKAMALNRLTDSADNFIHHLKSQLVAAVDEISMTEADSVKLEDVLNKLNIDRAYHVLFLKDAQGKIPALEIKRVVDFFRDSAISFVQSENKKYILEGINLNTEAQFDEESEAKVDWVNANFENVPVYVALSTLMNLQYEIKNTETQVLTDLLNKASASSKDNLAAQIADLGEKYETEKKDKEISLLEKDKELNDSKIAAKNQEIDQRESTIGIFAFVTFICAVLMFFTIRSNVLRKKANKILEAQKSEIEIQKELIEEKSREIIDSINYAKRLQQAILPGNDEIKAHLPDTFIYYQPKDIVAGDFYWMEHLDGMTYIAAADSTGHGVPGAMVSVVCSNALNRAVKEFGLRNTGEILDKTRELVIETFEKSDKNVKDGMDISLLRIQNTKERKTEIQWSGANNSLWYFQNNELTEIKANKQPIGKYNNPVPFTTHSKEFTSAASFYLFSDGYADQFSNSDKKLMTKKFKEVLLSIQQQPMHEQGKQLEKFHIDWKGNMEQTDDVLVIGIKI